MLGSELPFVIIFDNSSTKGKNRLIINKSHTRPTKVAVLPPIWGKTIPPATAVLPYTPTRHCGGVQIPFLVNMGLCPSQGKLHIAVKCAICTHDFYRAELKVSEFATVLWIYT